MRRQLVVCVLPILPLNPYCLDSAWAGKNRATDSMDRIETRQKIRMHAGSQREGARVRRSQWKDDDCNVEVGKAHLENKRGGREINVYSYVGDIDVRCR